MIGSKLIAQQSVIFAFNPQWADILRNRYEEVPDGRRIVTLINRVFIVGDIENVCVDPVVSRRNTPVEIVVDSVLLELRLNFSPYVSVAFSSTSAFNVFSIDVPQSAWTSTATVVALVVDCVNDDESRNPGPRLLDPYELRSGPPGATFG